MIRQSESLRLRLTILSGSFLLAKTGTQANQTYRPVWPDGQGASVGGGL